MAELYGGDYIYNVLSNDSSVTALVGTAIYTARLVPKTETSTETINYYRISPFDGGQEWFQMIWSIDCRSATEPGANLIAEKVSDALNRVQKEVNSKMYYGVVSVLSAIPPIDAQDVYNVPVQLNVRRRS